MAPRIKPQSRVSTEAWRFDNPKAEPAERWSFMMFGPSWRDERVIGTVVRSSGRSWIINWDLDEDNSSIQADYLMLLPDDTPKQVRPSVACMMLRV